MNRFIAYAKPTSHADANASLTAQFSACEALGRLYGIQSQLESRRAQSAGDTAVLTSCVRQLGPGDTLIIADIASLGDTPSEVLTNASKLVGNGVRVLAANLGGEVQLPLLRAFVGAFQPLETKLAKLDADLARERKDHDADMDQFAADYDRKVMEALATRGITISQLTTGTNPKSSISQPSKGAGLRQLREGLGLTQQEAGALVEPAISKPTVSRLEAQGTGEHFEELLGALTAEQYLRSKRPAPLPSSNALLPHEIATYRQHGIPTPAEEAAARIAITKE